MTTKKTKRKTVGQLYQEQVSKLCKAIKQAVIEFETETAREVSKIEMENTNDAGGYKVGDFDISVSTKWLGLSLERKPEGDE